MRGISASPTLGGMVRIDGWMTRLAGQALITALNALMPPPHEDDTRTPRQRRHDALENLTRHYLEHPDTPTVGGEKPMSTWSVTSPRYKAFPVDSTKPKTDSCSPSPSFAPLPVTAHSAGSSPDPTLRSST